MRILRDNKDSLMSVLEAMIHDPLVEWGADDRKHKVSESVALESLTVSLNASSPLTEGSTRPSSQGSSQELGPDQAEAARLHSQRLLGLDGPLHGQQCRRQSDLRRD